MVRLYQRRSAGIGPCPVCGAPNSTCTVEETHFKDPEIVDQRFARSQWRHVSRREVRRKLSDGRMIVLWHKGAPIPPEEALRQGVVSLDDMTPKEQQRVIEFVEAKEKGAAAIIQTSRGAVV